TIALDEGHFAAIRRLLRPYRALGGNARRWQRMTHFTIANAATRSRQVYIVQSFNRLYGRRTGQLDPDFDAGRGRRTISPGTLSWREVDSQAIGIVHFNDRIMYQSRNILRNPHH
ncbi:MAG: hypothetical protein ACRED1_03235, partial [Limisphaerales bacterium]